MVVISFRNIARDFKLLNQDLRQKYQSLETLKVEGIEYQSADHETKKESINVQKSDNLLLINVYPTLLL